MGLAMPRWQSGQRSLVERGTLHICSMGPIGAQLLPAARAALLIAGGCDSRTLKVARPRWVELLLHGIRLIARGERQGMPRHTGKGDGFIVICLGSVEVEPESQWTRQR